MKRLKKILAIIILMVIVGIITFNIGKKIGLNTDISSTSVTVEEVTVGTQSISKTLTSSGEIKSSETERLELETSYYFEAMCAETDDTILEGENILKYTNGEYLVAPFDLVISSYSVPDSGSICEDENYIEVQNLKDLVISISISESEIGNISVGQEAEISLTADSSKSYTGQISKIDAIGTYSSSGSTFTAQIALENDGDIKIGMSVSVIINIEELTDVIAVPINAVQINGDRRYVVVVENGETKEVDVETGLSDDEYVQILSGLEGGETVQITTTTKQSTIRSSEDSGNNEENFGGRGNMNMDGRRFWL